MDIYIYLKLDMSIPSLNPPESDVGFAQCKSIFRLLIVTFQLHIVNEFLPELDGLWPLTSN